MRERTESLPTVEPRSYRRSRPNQVCLLACLLMAAGTGSFAQETLAPSLPLQVDVPKRNFGFVIGDVVEQRIQLDGRFRDLDLSELSAPGRVSTWLARQSATMTTPDDDHVVVNLRYQIVNAPESIVNAALPELTLAVGDTVAAPQRGAANSGERLAPVFVAAWPFTLGPLTAREPPATIASQTERTNGRQTEAGTVGSTSDETDNTADNAADNAASMTMTANGIPLRPDIALPLLDESTPATRLEITVKLLALTLASWLGWFAWRSWRDRVRLPFARAAHALRRQGRGAGSGDSADTTWKQLHQAFNQTAGHAVTSASLDELLERHAWLAPQDEKIRAFYHASSARYFELPSREQPFAVIELADTLAEIEKRHSR